MAHTRPAPVVDNETEGARPVLVNQTRSLRMEITDVTSYAQASAIALLTAQVPQHTN